MKVLIVQLFPRQFQQLLQKYRGPHKLSYRDSTNPEQLHVLDGQIGRADKVILMTKFVAHKVSDHVPAEKRIFVNGGITDVIKTLGELK